MSGTKRGHAIKHRNRGWNANDVIVTPARLAAKCVELVPLAAGDAVLDPFAGKAKTPFLDSFPADVSADWCEIRRGRNFFSRHEPVDWCVSNPPYSAVDRVLAHSARVSQKGFAYLLLAHALTPRRIAQCAGAGFGLTTLHLCKVFQWYGISAFCVFERGEPGIVSFDRVVWR